MDRITSIDALIAPCDALLIVPPFAPLDRPCLGVHVLQACAREAGFSVSVAYANIWFAQWIGEKAYQSLLAMPQDWLLGERLFARFAYGTPPLGWDGADNVVDDYVRITGRSRVAVRGRLRSLLDLEERAGRWLSTGASMLAQIAPAIVGTTAVFGQTAAGLAVLRTIARKRPDTVRIIGGSGCQSEMAEGIRAVAPFVDAVFCGESEETFLAFLIEHAADRLPADPIIAGRPCMNLDALPTPDYAEYFGQLQALIPGSDILSRRQSRIPYESSRGSRMARRRRRVFREPDPEQLTLRRKSTDRVLEELWTIAARYPGHNVAITDSAVSTEYFHALLPRIRDELPALAFSYQVDASFTLDQMRTLAEAGAGDIQPGIDTLSSGLSGLMRKDTSVGQSIATLRYARMFDIDVHWQLSYGLPGDDLAYYLETLELLPLLRHLPPAAATARQAVISRLSAFFDRPEAFGITGLRPYQAYQDILPADAPVDKLAYFFEAEFACASLRFNEVIPAIQDELRLWNKAWHGAPGGRAVLHIAQRGNAFELRDTRGIEGGSIVERITRQQAEVALTGRLPADDAAAILAWAQARKVIVERDGERIPLATADYCLLKRMEQQPLIDHAQTVAGMTMDAVA